MEFVGIGPSMSLRLKSSLFASQRGVSNPYDFTLSLELVWPRQLLQSGCPTQGTNKVCRLMIVDCYVDSSFVKGPSFQNVQFASINSYLIYRINDVDNFYPLCGISHFLIESSSNDLSKFNFCSSASKINSNTMKLNTQDSICLQFILDSSVVYDYKFRIWMLTHNFLITKQSFEVVISVGCEPTSVSFSYQNISGMYPNPPHTVFVDSSSTATLTFAPFINDFAGTCPTQGHFKSNQNLEPKLTMSGLPYTAIPCTASLCSVGLDTSVKALYKFYVYAYARGFAYKYTSLI